MGKQDHAPETKARASRANVPGPGVIAKMKIAIKNVIEASSDIDIPTNRHKTGGMDYKIIFIIVHPPCFLTICRHFMLQNTQFKQFVMVFYFPIQKL